MNTIGFMISHKNEEMRRAILPEDISKIKNIDMLYFEKGYGEALGVSDEEYIAAGVKVVSREEALSCDVVADVKLGDADYLDEIKEPKILFGWAHAVQNIDFTTEAIKKGHTVVAWEEIFEGSRYFLYRNREVAGEAAVMHGFRYSRRMPYDSKVAIIGSGQTAKGALRVLHGLGADVDVFGRKHEKLFREKLFDYDVIVNCVMWDTSREDRLIYREDLKKMKPGTLIIDVSCDPNLEIETSHPTTIDDPVYTVDGVIHYVVDNTPAMFPITVTKDISKNIVKYIDMMVELEYDQYPENLHEATVIYKGEIRDARIAAFRKRKNIL